MMDGISRDDESAKEREFVAALERLRQKHGCFMLALPFPALTVIVAQLQLALRHPGMPHEAGLVGRGIVDAIIEKIGAFEPRLAELIREGFDPNFDVLAN